MQQLKNIIFQNLLNDLVYGKFQNRGYSDIIDVINSIDIVGCCTPEDSVLNHNHIVITLFYYPDWMDTTCNKQTFCTKFKFQAFKFEYYILNILTYLCDLNLGAYVKLNTQW